MICLLGECQIYLPTCLISRAICRTPLSFLDRYEGCMAWLGFPGANLCRTARHNLFLHTVAPKAFGMVFDFLKKQGL